MSSYYSWEDSNESFKYCKTEYQYLKLSFGIGFPQTRSHHWGTQKHQVWWIGVPEEHAYLLQHSRH